MTVAVTVIVTTTYRRFLVLWIASELVLKKRHQHGLWHGGNQLLKGIRTQRLVMRASADSGGSGGTAGCRHAGAWYSCGTVLLEGLR